MGAPLKVLERPRLIEPVRVEVEKATCTPIEKATTPARDKAAAARLINETGKKDPVALLASAMVRRVETSEKVARLQRYEREEQAAALLTYLKLMGPNGKGTPIIRLAENVFLTERGLTDQKERKLGKSELVAVDANALDVALQIVTAELAESGTSGSARLKGKPGTSYMKLGAVTGAITGLAVNAMPKDLGHPLVSFLGPLAILTAVIGSFDLYDHRGNEHGRNGGLRVPTKGSE